MKFTEFGFDTALESTLDDFETETAVLESFNNFASLMDDATILSEEIAMEGTGKLKANAQIFWHTLKEFIAKAISSIRELLKKIGIVASYKNVGGFVEKFSDMTGKAMNIFHQAEMMLDDLSRGKIRSLDAIKEKVEEFMEMKADMWKGLKEADASTAKSAPESQFKQFEKICEQTTNALQKISSRVESIARNAESASDSRIQVRASVVVKKCTQVSNTLTACYQYGSKKCAEAAA